ncbi:UBP-type zinc finger domain-containing protein [Sabulibacter ruber]|uniref:UBP-type zinc finger domain-containing protein n=1 Tax=Sabulibacter ruber TaxID=2811901 RepID=UPI001A975523|nr:UBP-type zinc finger domain-containing protein [Sabulibacter ruber]
MEPTYCTHLPAKEKLLKPTVMVCNQCLAMGSAWVHLRLCQTCGQVHCCDSSPNRHATQHFLETGHPVVSSAEPGESWAWCYPDELFMPLPAL